MAMSCDKTVQLLAGYERLSKKSRKEIGKEMRISQLKLRKMFDEPFDYSPNELKRLTDSLGCNLEDIFFN